MTKFHAHEATLAPEQIRRATVNDLKDRELFEGVDNNILESIPAQSVICRLDAQERLYPTRDGTDYIYIILGGYVAIWLISHLTHAGENFLAWRGPEQIIGEMRA